MISARKIQNERLLRFMRLPPKKKLEWLSQMHEFLRRGLTGKRRSIYYKLRESR